MIFRTISAKPFTMKLSCRIQNSGRLGFGAAEMTEMEINRDKFVKFVSCDDAPFTHLIVLDHPDDDAFQVKQSGEYCYLDTGRMFDYFDFDYANKTIMLDLQRDSQHDEFLGGNVYKIKVREKKPRKSTNATINDEQAEVNKNDEDITD